MANHTDERAPLEWLETKDYQRAWDRLVGRRIRAAREQAKEEEQVERKSGAPSSRTPRPIWMPSPTVSSQEAVAGYVARTQSWLSKLERGERSISVGDAHLFANHFGVNALEIVGPANPEEQVRFELDIEDIRRAREKAGLTDEAVSDLRGKAANRHRRGRH